MAKKKKGQPKEDLIDQLLDDVGDIAADPSLMDGAPPEISRVTSKDAFLGQGARHEEDVAPIGLTPDEEKVNATRVAAGNEALWGDLANGLDGEAGLPGESPFDSLGLEGDASGPNEAGFEAADPMNFPMGKKGKASKSTYQGPSSDGGFQSVDDLLNSNESPPPQDPAPHFESAEGLENEATRPLATAPRDNDATASIATTGASDYEATVAADGFANRRKHSSEPQEKVVIGALRGNRSGQVYTNMDASLAQAENLKIAQQRILELERENDRLRQENEEVSSAADMISTRIEELTARTTSLEQEKEEIREAGRAEVMILKGNLQFKESEVAKSRLKVEELEMRLRTDFKKIRVKERELENRLELARAEKAALMRAKDETILELKRKIDQMQSETDNYREKLLELNKTIDANQEQFKRTVRALRLALTNLEAKDENIVPLKKAE